MIFLRSSKHSIFAKRFTSVTPLGEAKLHAILASMAPRAQPKPCSSAQCPPLMLKTAANPGGLPIEAFDAIRNDVLADRSQFFMDLLGFIKS